MMTIAARSLSPLQVSPPPLFMFGHISLPSSHSIRPVNSGNFQSTTTWRQRSQAPPVRPPSLKLSLLYFLSLFCVFLMTQKKQEGIIYGRMSEGVAEGVRDECHWE
ncbi:hypothetical protein AAHE18_16G046600 [Arachis hypogaea]